MEKINEEKGIQGSEETIWTATCMCVVVGGATGARPGLADVVGHDQTLLFFLHLKLWPLTGLEQRGTALVCISHHNETCHSWKIPGGQEMKMEIHFNIFFPSILLAFLLRGEKKK